MLTDKMGCGGAQTHIISLSETLVKRGQSVTLVSSGGEGGALTRIKGVKHLRLPLNSHRPADIIACCGVLSALAVGGRFDLLHAHARVPALVGRVVRGLTGICCVCTAHARFSADGIKGRLSYWGHNGTMAVSEDLKQYLVDEYGLMPENIEVIPNGIDMKRFSPVRKKGPSGQAYHIVFLSRLDADCSSGAHLLCDIAPQLSRYYGRCLITIGGGGSELQALRRRAQEINKRLRYDCIRLRGHISDTATLFRDADVLVGVGRAAIEAAACGAGVIICGDEGYMGALTSKNFSMAAATNFCARGMPTATRKELFDALCAHTPPIPRELLGKYDITNTARQTAAFYKKAVAQAKHGDTVLLCGYYGFDNLGDNALLRAAIKRAEAEFSGAKAVALTRRGRRDEKRFCLRCIGRKNLFALLPELIRAKYFVLGGGTLLQDKSSFRSLVYYCGILQLAAFFGAEPRIWGGGIGELSNRASVALAASALSRCKYCGMRDKVSLRIARQLLSKKGKSTRLCLEEDLAEQYYVAEKNAAATSRINFLLSGAFAGRVPKSFFVVAPKGNENVSELWAFVNRLARGGRTPLFVVMHKSVDTKICRQMQKRFGGGLLENICFSDLVAISRGAECVCSMRFHALVAARISGVPTYGFGEERKIREFVRLSSFAQ